jgi:hypothetical protein
LQVIGSAKVPNDELVDLQTPNSSASNREATDRDSADGQCTNCQRAECLCTDCESPQGARFPRTEDRQKAPSHRITRLRPRPDYHSAFSVSRMRGGLSSRSGSVA